MRAAPRRLVRFIPEGSDMPVFGLTTDQPARGDTVPLITGDVFGEFKESGETSIIGKLLSPVAAPPSILCIGLNYRQHAIESGMAIPPNPVLFMKAANALTNPEDPILIPVSCQNPLQVDYEVEMVIVMKKPAKNVSAADALDYVLGYTIANDVSARTWQLDKDLAGGQWGRGKTFDTFCPLGPCITLQENGFDPNNLRLYTLLNGERMQDSNTNDLIFNVQQLVESLSQSTTLLPGTIILTGTPSGVGFARSPKVFLKDGDQVVVAVEGIGELSNPVVNEQLGSNL